MLYSVIYTCFAFKIYNLCNPWHFLFISKCLFIEHEFMCMSTFISIASEWLLQYNTNLILTTFCFIELNIQCHAFTKLFFLRCIMYFSEHLYLIFSTLFFSKTLVYFTVKITETAWCNHIYSSVFCFGVNNNSLWFCMDSAFFRGHFNLI